MNFWDASEDGGREFVHDLVGAVATTTILSGLLEVFALGTFNVYRTVFTLGFCYLLYKKRNWARLVVSPLWCFAGIYIAYFSVQIIHDTEFQYSTLFGGFWFVYGTGLTLTSLTLLFSSDVKKYFMNEGPSA